MRVKVTRIEIWEVRVPQDVQDPKPSDLLEGLTDDVLNSQDEEQMLGYHVFEEPTVVIPREIVELKIEEVK